MMHVGIQAYFKIVGKTDRTNKGNINFILLHLFAFLWDIQGG